ncbi:MAG: BON domain-containing protein [Acidobacteria bacterium]|nr:BON domain-containing protein [Acidobacteriota bacterium]
MKLAIFLLSLACLSAQPHTRPPATPPAHKRTTTPPPKLSDAEIQARIQGKLAKSKIGKNGFKFSTSGGVTTIEGKANVIQHKGAATRMAKAAGARAVINKIQISEDAREAARAKLASGRRRAQVKRGEPRTLVR